MSAISDAAVVHGLIADYAATDSGGKLNVVGGGLSLLGLQPTTPVWLTAPFSIAVMVGIPEKFADEQFALEIELRSAADDSVVSVASQGGGVPQALRIAQVQSVGKFLATPGVVKPTHALAQHVAVVNFALGLPLVAGESYYWKVKIDGRSRKGWQLPFSVPTSLPDPVVGGPAGSSTIDGVEDIAQDDDDSEG